MIYEKLNHIFVEKEAGDRTINVIVKDKLTGKHLEVKAIKRALLAKYMNPNSGMLVSASNGKFVIEG